LTEVDSDKRMIKVSETLCIAKTRSVVETISADSPCSLSSQERNLS